MRIAILIAAIFFLAIAPTITWLEFSGGSENLNVGTVLEMRRGGPWLVPTLKGQPRTTKPPLTAWITASSVRPSTMHQLDSTDVTVRDAGYRSLAWQVRWPSLLSACLMLVAIYELGRIVGQSIVTGLVAMTIAGSSVLFLLFARSATTDVQLALWVSVANVFLARAIFEKQWWVGCVGGAVALALAVMSKGPVALVQTVVPALIFLVIRKVGTRPVEAGHAEADVRRSAWLPILVSIVLLLALSLPWFLYVAGFDARQWVIWYREVTREGATDLDPDPWWMYFGIFGLVLPWTVWLIAGIVIAIRDGMSDRAARLLFPLLLLVAPLIIMSFGKDKNARYLLPLVGPCAILAAGSFAEHLKSFARGSRGRIDRIVVSLHWITLAAIGAGLPLAGISTRWLQTVEGGPWYPLGVALTESSVALLVILGAILLSRRRPIVLVGATAALMLLIASLFVAGYRNSPDGRSEIKPLADAICERFPSGAEVINFDPPGLAGKRSPIDLSIYLNRVVTAAKSLQFKSDATGPQVIVLFQRDFEPVPETPPGSIHFAEAKWKHGMWHAYERVAPATTQPSPK